jgi:hypothetical protein
MPKPTSIEHRGHRKRRVLEQLQRDESVVTHELLADDERGDAQSTDDVAGDGVERVPAPVAALLGDQQQRHEGDDDGRGPPPVDAHLATCADVQEAQHHGQRDDADRKVDEEDPAPSGDEEDLVGSGEEPADERADQAETPNTQEVALVLRAFAGARMSPMIASGRAMRPPAPRP